MYIRRNFILGVINGAIFHAVLRMTAASGVMTLLILELTGSERLVGLMAGLTNAGWGLAPLLTAPYVEAAPSKRAVYRWAACVRVVVMWTAVSLLFTPLAHTHKVLLFWLLTLLILVRNTAGGLSFLPFADIVDRSVPSRLRGTFFAMRAGFGQLASIAAAAYAAYVLSDRSGLTYPYNFGILLAVAAAGHTVSLFCFSMVAEPPSPPPPPRPSLKRSLLRGRYFLRRDSSFRRFLYLRACNSAAQLTPLFIVACAKVRFAMPDAMVGAYMIANSVGILLGNAMFARLSDRRGNRLMLTIYTVISLLPSLVCLATLTVAQWLSQVHLYGTSLALLSFGGALFLAGLARAAANVSELNYVLDLAPPRRLPSYFSISATLMFPLSFLPMVGGVLASLSYGWLFSTAAAASLIGITVLRRGLREPRDSHPAISDAIESTPSHP